MSAQACIKIFKGRRHFVAVCRSEREANVVDDGGAYCFWVAAAMFHQYVSEGNDEEERAERVSLRNSFLQCVAYGVVDVEGGERVSSEVYARSMVVKETKP